MSGICGIVRLDGGVPSPAEIDAMCQILQRRGPDGTGTWVGACAALGHTLLATTPEAMVERLPLTHAESGCTITADVRLDNREELLDALGLTGETRVIGDGELVLLSYLRWGEDCPKHLLGDFAFAIWDERQRQLFCARDHMGMRQLIYCHVPGQVFIFATETEAVLAHSAAPRRINEGRIADFLEGMEDLGLRSTFYEQLFRLPPAHILRVRSGRISVRRYWQIEPQSELVLESDEAYAEAFLGQLTIAVQCRLRSASAVGSMLSGGLDSGSVAAIAARQLLDKGAGPLRTYSVVGPDPGHCPETRSIHSAMTMAGLEPTVISLADLSGVFDDLRRFTDASAEPFDGHMVLVRAVCLLAHRHGTKIVLDGVGGDAVLSSDPLIASLIRKGRLVQAVREARGEARFWGESWPAWRALLKGAAHACVPRFLRDFRHHLSWQLRNRRMDRQSLIRQDFARRTGLAAKRARYRHQFGSDLLAADWRPGAVARLASARERYDRVASALAIELRDPFIDIRLVRFCLSLPVEQLQRDGWPKVVMRRAMAGILPDELRWRSGKEHLGLAFIQAMRALAQERGQPAQKEETIGAYVDLDRARAAKARAEDSRRFAAWSETVYLRQWLESALAVPERVAPSKKGKS